MDYSKDYNNDREPLDLHEQAGLLFQGIDEDGRKEWLGDKKAWDRYEELERQESIDLEIDMAIEKKHELIDEGLRALKDNNALNEE
jgi:hypothetical protein